MKLHALSSKCTEFDLERLGFDDCERELLAVARYFFFARSVPEQQSWQVAFSVAARFGCGAPARRRPELRVVS